MNQPKLKTSSDAQWRDFYEQKCRELRKELAAIGTMASVTTCKECGCQTGGGNHCYEHEPVTIWRLKDGSYYEDCCGSRKHCFKETAMTHTEIFAAKLKETLENRGPDRRGQRILSFLGQPDSPHKQRMLVRMERHAAAEIGGEFSVGVNYIGIEWPDWSTIDWIKVIGVVIQVLMFLLMIFSPPPGEMMAADHSWHPQSWEEFVEWMKEFAEGVW